MLVLFAMILNFNKGFFIHSEPIKVKIISHYFYTIEKSIIHSPSAVVFGVMSDFSTLLLQLITLILFLIC